MSEQEMEAYIRGLIPNLAQLRDMPAAFVQMYCRIAAHKFFFFCDPNRRGLPLVILRYMMLLRLEVFSCKMLLFQLSTQIIMLQQERHA